MPDKKDDVPFTLPVALGITAVLLAIGLCCGGWGLHLVTAEPTASCGGVEMSAGDTCDHYRDGDRTSTTDTAQEKRWAGLTGTFWGWGGIIGGGFALLLIAGVWIGYRDDRTAPTS